MLSPLSFDHFTKYILIKIVLFGASCCQLGPPGMPAKKILSVDIGQGVSLEPLLDGGAGVDDAATTPTPCGFASVGDATDTGAWRIASARNRIGIGLGSGSLRLAATCGLCSKSFLRCLCANVETKIFL